MTESEKKREDKRCREKREDDRIREVERR